MPPICYSCGCPMVDEAYYRDHTEDFTSVPKFTHDEHIIHNALYGRLKSSQILCKDCGSKFGHEVDGEFVSLFTPVTERIKDILLSKQHGKNSVNTLQGVLYEDPAMLQERAVEIRDNVVYPKEPYYTFDASTDTVTIYASKARGKHYRNLVTKELAGRGVKLQATTFHFVEDIQDKGILGVFFTQGVERFNERFRLGLNKIALGFAMYAGVARTQVPRVLEIDDHNQGKLVSTNNLIPFFPIGALDGVLEMNRPALETHYPSHTLTLFSQPRENGGMALFCYIDLFSTFQHYVLLNENYTGEAVFKSYHQATTKSALKRIDLQYVRWKHWNIVAEDFEVDMTRFPGGTMEDRQAFIQKGIDAYTFNPQLNLRVEVEKMYAKISPLALLVYRETQKSDLVNPVLDTLRSYRGEQMNAVMGELYYYFTLDDEAGYQRFRTSFLEEDGVGALEVLSYPSECRRPPMSAEHFQAYGHLKFRQISAFIDESRQK
ncbi:MAG: HNH endonuclease [Hymenobacter sp.]|nr:MAG: HNH endonuclease [Hymenobacter sp.]